MVAAGSVGLRIRNFFKWKGESAEPAELARASRDALRDRDYFLLSAIARNPRTPASTLLELARSGDPNLERKRTEWINFVDRDALAVVRKVIRNPNVPPEANSFLARSRNEYVMGDVAAHKGTDASTLRTIYERNQSYLVLWGLSRNANTPSNILKEIAQKPDPYVALGLAGNPSTPHDVLEHLASHKDELVRDGVASNRSTQSSALETLSHDSSKRIRYHVVSNPNTTVDILKNLMSDSDAEVRNRAHAVWEFRTSNANGGE